MSVRTEAASFSAEGEKRPTSWILLVFADTRRKLHGMESSDPMLGCGLSVVDADGLLGKLESHPDLIASHWLTLEKRKVT